MELTVWIDDWQMQCCGDAFRIGSRVSWTVREPQREWLESVAGPEAAASVDVAEEHHGGGDTHTVAGTVASITTVHCRYEPRPGGDPRHFHPVPGSQLLTEVEEASGWTPGRDDRKFVGYLARLAVAEG